ncbi:MAG: electron transfer flavoprotein-ubiquinone oxidoreductase [Planctomycetes bacterium]|nr:electron transfer flavoprotein-ubiquinone oxidoreductase [Planctomycetota bacterium]
MTERETMDFDVVIVGGGPAGLATAIHLANLVERHNQEVEKTGQGEPLAPEVVLIEKAKEIGAHAISGAVLDPKGLDQLLPGWRQMDPKPPLEAEVHEDYVLWLTETGGLRLPVTPPALRNHGNHVVSLNRLVRWLGQIAEVKGIQIFPEFPGARLTRQGSVVQGVQLADMGLDKQGQPKSNHQPGAILRAKLTVLAEGSRGSMTKQLVQDLGLQGRNPMVYAIGVKEVWEVPAGQCPPGLVVHTMGYPLKGDTFGGGWIYGMGKAEDGQHNLVSIGLVVGLDYRDPALDPHRQFQRMKLNPKVRRFLEGGRMVSYGAKSLPEGGLYGMPRLYGDGFLIAGDAGGFMNSMRLKGIHLALRSGMLAAETVFEALKKGDFSAATTKAYDERFRADWSHAEMRTARNFHQGFHKGLLHGLANAGFATLFGGRGFLWQDEMVSKAGHTYMQTLAAYHGGTKPKAEKLPEDGKLTFDKLTDVYSSGTKHEEDQPCHLVVADTDLCSNRCTVEYGNPCQHFCPAAVYEMVAKDGGGLKLQINASNCVHCKTCDIMDPYQIINWVTPEGGGGPSYQYL